MAAEFLERVVFAYEASYHPAFVQVAPPASHLPANPLYLASPPAARLDPAPQAWLRGDARMLAGVAANAPFLRALHAHTVAVSRRGCHHAAVATSLLTLSLDRTSDPTRMRMLLDVLALRASRPHTLWLVDQSFDG